LLFFTAKSNIIFVYFNGFGQNIHNQQKKTDARKKEKLRFGREQEDEADSELDRDIEERVCVRAFMKHELTCSTSERNRLTKAAAAVQAQIDAFKEAEDGWQEERDERSAVRDAQDDVENVEETSEESEDEEMSFDSFGISLDKNEPRHPRKDEGAGDDSLAIDKRTHQVSKADARAYQRECLEKQKRNKARIEALGLQSAVQNKKEPTTKKRQAAQERKALLSRRSTRLAVQAAPFVV
jgi:hypothetical protein